MNTVLNPLPTVARHTQFIPTIRIVIIYENGGAALRAKTVLDAVADRFRDQFVFDIGLWSFDMLKLSRVRNIAMQEASESDLVFISIENDARIPAEVLYGITAWRPLEGEHPSTVALLWYDQGERAARIPVNYSDLRALAEKKGMSLFGGDMEWAEENIAAEVRKLAMRTAEGKPVTAFQHEQSYIEMEWGIND
jgi:hypothetical protein